MKLSLWADLAPDVCPFPLPVFKNIYYLIQYHLKNVTNQSHLGSVLSSDTRFGVLSWAPCFAHHVSPRAPYTPLQEDHGDWCVELHYLHHLHHTPDLTPLFSAESFSHPAEMWAPRCLWVAVGETVYRAMMYKLRSHTICTTPLLWETGGDNLCSQSPIHVPLTVARQAPLSIGFPSKNTGLGSHSLLQGFFPPRDWTQVSCISGRFFIIEYFAICQSMC